MSDKRRKQLLEAVAENPAVIQYVKLFRMPLFLTVLDDELKKCDDAVWESEGSATEAAMKVMPDTLRQFSVPGEEIESVIAQCVEAFEKE